MGDFVAPAAANGNSPGMGAAAGGQGSSGIPKHSTVVQRLRQRIEGFRRHHNNCEVRRQQAQAQQIELDRQETLTLHQRCLELKAKKTGKHKQDGAFRSKHCDPEPPSSAPAAVLAAPDQRSNTLIALQETVKRKLEGARSPLNGDLQNGVSDSSFSPSSKRVRKEGPGLDQSNTLSNKIPMPSVSPLHQIDIKSSLPIPTSGNNSTGFDDINKEGRHPRVNLQANGTRDDDDFNLILTKELKQEPIDDPSCMDSSDTSLLHQNKLFSDINLNEQEWQELIDELTSTVPEDDMHDLFNEDFDEKKEMEVIRPTSQTPVPPDNTNIKSEMCQSPFNQMSMGSPQVRPSSSGPPFSNVSTVSSVSSVSSISSLSAPATSPVTSASQPQQQTPNQSQAHARSGNGFLMTTSSGSGSGQGPGPGPGPGSGPGTLPSTGSDLSRAEQLKQMAAQQQQRAMLLQQKQHTQPHQQNQTPSWSPAAPPHSPFGGPFNPDKPNSPMMYPQAFNNQKPMVPTMTNNPQKAMNNYLSQNHMNIMNQQPNTMGQTSVNKQPMLSYANTKPLSHYNIEPVGQRMTPPMVNQNKAPMMPYLPQQQPHVQPQASHISEEQKRLLLMKQKGLLPQTIPYGTLPSHGSDQSPVGTSRPAASVQPPVPVPVPVPGPGTGVPVPGSMSGNPGGPSYLGNQQQAVMMKQLLMEQERQRMHQLHMMEQQKQQLFREQRQQQQLLAEQQQQLQQQQHDQMQRHLPRPHPQCKDQHRNPYPVQQVSQYQGTAQELAAARNQALQNARSPRMMAQNPGMMQMTPVQNSGVIPATTGQSEIGMVPYSNAQSSQQGMYSMSPGMNQILQHSNQSNVSMARNISQMQKQPIAGQGVGMVPGYGQNLLGNPVLAQQQQVKGPVGQPMPKAQAQRLQLIGNSGTAAQSWQQHNLQSLPNRTQANSDLSPFSNKSAYPMQPGQTKMAKQHFSQTMGQPVLDTAGTVGGQMMSHFAGHPRTNQPRQIVMSGMTQTIHNMTGFNQATGQQLTAGCYAQSNPGQGYHTRTTSQDMSFNYVSQSGAGSFSNLSDGGDLMDSLIKSGSTEGWMQEFDEIFGNQQ
ncbi:mastermind-like protein 3 [Carcharodon carcharias]|uniref:mastermind-like protein 3 n=1 Tax=Carcharodon carcharias TaxID=13397 RepID=UPI001B7E67BC|nr:mastermind-like protein 3 [Carcharodon carcharias]